MAKKQFKLLSIRISMNQYVEMEDIVSQDIGGVLNISDFARRSFAAYIDQVRASSSKGKRAVITPEDKVVRKMEEKHQAKVLNEEVASREQALLCVELEGTVREENDVKYCEWKTYQQMGPIITEGELEVPFEMLTRQHVKDQYQPNRNDVERQMKK